MKNFALTFFLMVIFGCPSFGQSFTLADDAGPLANGADVVQSGPSDTLQLITWLHLTNISGNTLRVMMKKEEITMLPETSSSICWAGYCYGPEMMVSSEPLVMLPGETVSGCFGHFGPHGSRGVSVIRWTFFNESSPADSVSMTAHYATFPFATENIPASPIVFSAGGPIPANDQLILNYTLPPGKPGKIELRNTYGNLVSAGQMVSLSGTVTFCTAHLPSAIYYSTLVVDGKPVSTKKVPVCH
ncbi:MAG: hypothetical protein NT040_05150 [Bacteroidetes bacterium]|nr:hypothetical protein [Bacteroidota bacterium]